MTIRAIPLLVCLATLGCGAGSPPDQVAFAKDWRALRSDWDAQEGNDLRRSAVEDQARTFFNTRRTISGWTAKVVEVKSALGATWVDAEEAGVQFMLRPPAGGEEHARPAFAQLSPGDRINFNGTTKGELSITMAGALREPVISVTLSWIQKPR